MQSQGQGFIGSRLKAIPHSALLFATPTQLLLQARRQLIRLDLPTQTLVYSNADQDRLVHAGYHIPLQLYILLTEKNLIAVNGQGEIIRRFSCEQLIGAKYLFLVGLQDGYRGTPNHRDDYLIFVKGDHLYSCPLAVSFQRQMIKNKGICDFGMELGTLELHESPEYIENVCWLRDECLLVLWNANETYIYSLPAIQGQGLKRLHIYNKISRRENLSLTYAVSLPLKIMAAGYQSGTVKLYHFDQTHKYIQELRGHQAACLSLLIPSGTPNFLYSASADSSVRIWSLLDFQQVYCLQLDLLVSQVKFVTAQVLFIVTADTPKKTYLCYLNTDLLQPMVNENRGGELQGLKCDGEWCMAMYSNSHVEFMPAPVPGGSGPSGSRGQAASEKIEYPEKYGNVREVFRLHQDTYAIALQRGFSLVRFSKRQVTSQNFQLKKLVYNQSIAKTRQEDGFIELIHEKLLGTYLFNVLMDPKDIPVSIKVAYVYFYQVKEGKAGGLPRWDGSTSLKGGKAEGDKTYCVLGTAKGEIYFVDIEQRTHYHCKVYFHTAEITFIRAVAPPYFSAASTSHCFLSMSSDRQLVLWRLSSSQPPSPLAILSFNRDFTYRDLFHNYLVLGEKSGELNILQILTTPTLSLRKSTSTTGHIRAVICGDYMSYGGNKSGSKEQALFLSSGDDSVIKIWRGVQKQLLFQLKLFGIVSAVCFTRSRLDLIVCHNQQISVLKDHRLKSLRRTVALLSLPGSDCNVEEIDPRAFFMRTNPTSPLPRQRLQRLTSRYVNLFHKMTVREEEGEGSLREQKGEERREREKQRSDREARELNLEPATSLPPNISQKPPSFQRFQSLQRMPQRVKRFHINSSSIETESEVSLPRINTKLNAMEKVMPRVVGKEEFFIAKGRKDRSFSNAGRQNG